MPQLVFVFVVLALICFLVSTVRGQFPAGRPVDWTAAGLGLLTLAWLVSTRGA
jgi:hypothetical protein